MFRRLPLDHLLELHRMREFQLQVKTWVSLERLHAWFAHAWC